LQFMITINYVYLVMELKSNICEAVLTDRF
jgi:hypothetical protein